MTHAYKAKNGTGANGRGSARGSESGRGTVRESGRGRVAVRVGVEAGLELEVGKV